MIENSETNCQLGFRGHLCSSILFRTAVPLLPRGQPGAGGAVPHEVQHLAAKARNGCPRHFVAKFLNLARSNRHPVTECRTSLWEFALAASRI